MNEQLNRYNDINSETEYVGVRKLVSRPRFERSKNELEIHEYALPDVKPDYYTPEYDSILHTLTQAARRSAQIFSVQEGDSDRANFYPKGVTKKAMREAIIQNPELGSPYTIVVQTENGELVPIEMSDAYNSILQETGILKLLDEAALKALEIGDIQLHTYLKSKGDALENGNYEESEKIWLAMDPEPIVDIVIGPYDRYTDKFLGRKYAYQAWAGYLDKEKTEVYQDAVDDFLGWWESTSGEKAPKVKMRIDHTRIMAGQAAKEEWSGNSLPCQPEWRQKYGSKFTIFQPVLEDVFRKRLTVYRKIIDSGHRTGVTDEMVARADLKRHLYHETAHSLGISTDIDQRLENATWLRELRSDLLAVVGINQQENASQKEKELAIATLFANGVLDYRKYRDKEEKHEYYVARSIILDRMVRDGAVTIEDGQIKLTDKIFKEAEVIYSEVEKLHQYGTPQEIEKYKKKNFTPNIYQSLAG